MAGKSFENIIEGKQNILEKILDTEHGLLSKLEADKVVTRRHRNAIEVTCISVVTCFACINF